ncbi:hypothetical protein PV325_011774, partial [Microctonus aethiopoides]
PLSRRSCGIPDGFPLDCVASIRDFEDATDEEYCTVVSYCKWLSGTNPCECANLYFKHLFTERLSESVTWTGSNETMALKGSRIMEAFEEAMNYNTKFPKVNRADFENAIKRAVHSAKERNRKSRAATANRNAGARA